MASRKHILIVEDERDLADLIAYNLEKAGYATSVANAGRRALEIVEQTPPDLIILDLMLPELSGTEIATRLRSTPRSASIPIIMLTAKTSEAEQLTGLALGADDYITKPCSMKVLAARVAAVLRRSESTPKPDSALRLGPISVDLTTHEAQVNAQTLKLTLTEFRLLASLLQAGGRVLSRAALMSKAMGPGVTVTERTIDVHITAIRKKLGASGSMIRTVRGVGYRATAELGADEDVAEFSDA
ncbi:MAG: response regulator [Phycisphaerales bacterium]|nr:MAG: response regulator transcription factor [Phycisphaerales bacterium]